MNIGAEQLLDDFNYYRFQTNNIQQLRSKGKRIGSLGVVVAFIEVNGVPVELMQYINGTKEHSGL